MVKVEFKDTDNRIVEGDVFFVNNETALQLIYIDHDGSSPQYGLLDMDTATFEKLGINAVPHAINWVKKHYGSFRLVKKKDVEVTLVLPQEKSIANEKRSFYALT